MFIKVTSKSLLVFLTIGFFYGLNPLKLAGQSAVTGVPFIENILDVRLQSLGNSFVSYDGLVGMQEINPAGIGIEGDLIPYFTTRESFADIRFYQFGASYKKEKLGFAVSSRVVPYPTQTTTNAMGGNVDSHKPLQFYQAASISYEINKNWSIGTGLNYIHSDLSMGSSINGEETKVGRTLSLDLGAIYKTSFIVRDKWTINPNFGLSLSDFGDLIKYTEDGEGDPLPMIFRTGLGLEIITLKDWNGFQMIGVSSALSISKMLVALEFKNDGSVKRIGPFQTLLKGWGTYRELNPNNGQFIEYSLPEQFIYHAGLEMTFLESFSLRLGHQYGQELNDFRSLNSWGFGIDVYYIGIDYVNSSHTSSSYTNANTLLGKEVLQIKGRIPLDGKSPKSLLRLLF